jgi:hypothetical protein
MGAPQETPRALQLAPTARVQIELSPVGWGVASDLPYEEWLRHGSRLGVAARSAGWWLGDWLRYGTARYGAKYKAAVRVTGYDRQTLMNMVYVASRFEVSRRREQLSFSHHAELAALGTEEQEWWLERAAAQRMSVRDLRDELAAGREVSAGRAAGQPALERRVTSRRTRSARAGEPGARTVTCPHCGEQLTV